MLYVMRHGKTEWNEVKRLQGKSDIPLNEEGRNQAKQARDEYKDVHFDVCYCSPLIRAKETCELVLEGRDIPVIYDSRLEEMGFGIAEGEIILFENSDHPIMTFFKSPGDYKEPVEDGESITDLFSRTGEFLEEVVYPQLKEGLDILIVGHGAMNSSIICQIKNKPVEEFWSEGIENCKLKKLV